MPSTQSRVKYQRLNFHESLDTVPASHGIQIVSVLEYKTVYKNALDVTLSCAYERGPYLPNQVTLHRVLELVRAYAVVLFLTFKERFSMHKPDSRSRIFEE